MNQKESFLLPGAILVAGALLALTVFVVRSGDPVTPLDSVAAIRPVTPDDHIVGSPDAPIIIVEYSDVDCAYCKDFQATLSQLMSEYAETGRVAWVYRHFPVINLHENAALHAEAAECVAEQGDDTLFFRFIDTLQQTTPGNDEFDPGGYPGVIESLGLSYEAFESCMTSDRNVERVTLDFENAVAAGGEGTPYTVVLVAGQTPIPITGALPYEAMKEIIDQALTKVP